MMSGFSKFCSACLLLASQVSITVSEFLPFMLKEEESTVQTLSLASSCNNLADGVHYIKPTEDGEIMPAVCNDGYTIINLALDQDSVSSYFSSFTQAHWDENGVFAPDCDASVGSAEEMTLEGTSWRDWFMPATSDTKFRVSKDCTTCESSLSYGDNTAYYLTNYYFCTNKHHSNACAYTRDELLTMDTLSYDVNDDTVSMCNLCDDSLRSPGVDGCSGSSDDEWCDCLSLQLDADTQTNSNHDHCVRKKSVIVKPSIANDGNWCTCYQTPDDSTTTDSTTDKFEIQYQSHDDLDSILPAISKKQYEKYVENGVYVDSIIRVKEDEDSDEEDTDEDSDEDDSDTKVRNGGGIRGVESKSKQEECAENYYYLSNEDFKDGTIRIQECGNYILTEDILIHFNKPNEDDLNDIDWSPNGYNYENFPWYPTIDQQFNTEDESKRYEGANVMHGSYQFGFFSAITIETNYVTIDLNEHIIEMDFIYYLQQRIFSLIELSNKQFVTDQGPANLGKQDWVTPKHIEIKNGQLGRVSHQGIHGNHAKYLTVDNVKIHSFDVSGIQCNGCTDVSITNTVVGPQNTDIPVLGRYTHGRSLIPRLQYLVDNYGDVEVKFSRNYRAKSRTQTIEQLADAFVEQMDLVYHYIVHGIDWSNTDRSDEWSKAKELFINPNGYQDGGSSYGILLNGVGTGVVAFGRRKTHTSDITLENVEIYGIRNQPWERFWAKQHGSSEIQGFFFDTLNWKNLIDAENGYLYNGDVYHDLVFATQKIANQGEFCLFNTLFTSPIIDWVFNDDLQMLNRLQFYCGSDVQSHDAKGTMGLRVDAVQGLTLNNVYIHDIENFGELGDESDYLCDNWDTVSFLKDIHSSIEPGYTGTRANGIITDFAKISSMKNVFIENVQSQYGTATGVSFYAGTRVQEVSDVVISDVRAGWGLESDRVDSLSTQNLVPKACAMHKGESETNYQIVIDEDGFDDSTVIGVGISGYETCEDDDKLGTVYDTISDVKTNDKFIESKLLYARRHVTLDSTTRKTNNTKTGNILNRIVFIMVACLILAMIICTIFAYFENMRIMSKVGAIVARAKRFKIRSRKNRSNSKRESAPLLGRIISNNTRRFDSYLQDMSIDNEETTQGDEFYVAL